MFPPIAIGCRNAPTISSIDAWGQPAIAEGGSKLANTQLMPRYQLMMEILDLWPK
jgi:hypothetical protein